MSDAPAMFWLGPEDPDEDITPELVGSKAEGVWRMAKLGLRTPHAFALPTSLCALTHSEPEKAKERITAGLRAGVERIEAATGRKLGDARAPLAVSVRSGAAKSMPGMLSTVLNVGLGPQAVHGLIRLTGDPRFAWDTYRRFIESYAVVVGSLTSSAFAECIARMMRAEQASDESDLDGEALERLAFDYGDVAARNADRPMPADPMDQLLEAALAVFRSWNSRKAREYRRLNHLEDLVGTAVTVQAMVYGNAGPTSGSGVAFSRNPATGEKGLYADFLFAAQGEDVVSGRRKPVDASALAERLPAAHAELKRGAALLEKELRDVQDMEFTVENGELYFLQTRSAKRSPRAAVQVAVDMVHEGVITIAEALRRLEGIDLGRAAPTRFDDASIAIAKGLPAGPGVASGRAAFDGDSAKSLAQTGDPVILVRREPATDDIEGISVAQGILTASGGRTAHAAVVARQMSKVCIVGCDELILGEPEGQATIAGHVVHKGDWISLDGDKGEVTLGRRTIVTEAPRAALNEIDRWREAAA